MQQLSIQNEVTQALEDLNASFPFNGDHLLVVGTSTSEVLGEQIGTSGTIEVAEQIFHAISQLQQKTNVQIAFQCCEHLNRCLVIEREIAKKLGYEVVSVVPSAKAGGSMATYAFKHLKDPVIVEFVQADAGIDIGDTLIGMHLKHVAVPVRSTIKNIGSAHVTMAKTRPKFIGGERAVYSSKANVSCK